MIASRPNILALYASKNHHGNDARGAFIPQATLFAKYHRALGAHVDLAPFDPTLLPGSRRRKAFDATILTADPDRRYDAIAYFGHGTRSSLPSAGHTIATMDSLLSAIDIASGENVIVILYACLTGEAPRSPSSSSLEGDGGIGDMLRDGLRARGKSGHVDTHTTAAHTTINPYARRFTIEGSEIGGHWLIEPNGKHWAAWRKRLKSDYAIRFGFPFMTDDALRAELERT